MQLAQSVHAALKVATKLGAENLPENVVVLSVSDKDALLSRSVGAEVFYEPDLDGEATAFSLVSDGRHLSDLPLAGGHLAMV